MTPHSWHGWRFTGIDGGDRELATICGASGAVKRGLDHGSIEGDICAAGGSDTMEVDDMGCPKHTRFLGKNKHYLDNDAVAPKEKVTFILKSLEKNFYRMLHSLRSERATSHLVESSYDWVVLRISDLSRQIEEGFVMGGKRATSTRAQGTLATIAGTEEPQRRLKKLKGEIICYHCQKPGHVQKECWKLYPDLKSVRKRGSASGRV